jgi:hypothetical protein
MPVSAADRKPGSAADWKPGSPADRKRGSAADRDLRGRSMDQVSGAGFRTEDAQVLNAGDDEPGRSSSPVVESMDRTPG